MSRKLKSDDWLAVPHALERTAAESLGRLHDLGCLYRDAHRAIAAEYGPGALPALLSPQSVSDLLSMSIDGGGKLLGRTASANLLVEIAQRRSWRLFLAPDIAIAFAYMQPKHRSRKRSGI
ncbi:hypothetical protein DFR49_0938 [Hephaestia caeni]|uniref:Uncharacterized protein n=1 Tax=Hephaestia caeni TaxID=645617 RepID=A0A397PGW0_9SPHN|nr:hypothetical protein [Hephaestia caeni]RIA46397.1 hypothetical protein DFR49_0938 [Hephaestia caeni]